MSEDDLSPASWPQEVCVFPGPIPMSVQSTQVIPQYLPSSQVAPPLPPPPKPFTQLQRLSAKAAPFQPLTVAKVSKPSTYGRTQTPSEYKKCIAEVICLAQSSIKLSEYVKNVEISEDASGWSVVIQPSRPSVKTELLESLAQKALLDATETTNCIFVLGYCSPAPFSTRPQGFGATLVAMTNAKTACWHMFKKGFCRHGDGCDKQHPPLEVPVHVLVEGVQLDTCTRLAGAFKSQVAELALTVTTTLADSPYVETVKAFKIDHQGWTIEMTPKGVQDHKEHLLTLAKNALFSASSNSEILCIMGYAGKPFMENSRGIVTILGNMRDESKICWDMYMKGACSCSGDQCRWEHPSCLMPINIVLQERSYQ